MTAVGRRLFHDLARREGIGSRPALALLLLALVSVPRTALADTIYLTNGRAIRTADARIEGDRVIFRQFGGEVSIPRSVVARIVEDDEVERRTPPPGGPAAQEQTDATPSATAPADTDAAPGATGTAESDSPPGGGAEADAVGRESEGTADRDAEGGGTADDPTTAAYWIEQIRKADERIARAKEELDRLPYYDAADRRLLRFSGQARYFMAERDRWEEMLRDFEATRRQLMEGARRAGITPGALRDGLRRATRGSRPAATAA